MSDRHSVTIQGAERCFTDLDAAAPIILAEVLLKSISNRQ